MTAVSAHRVASGVVVTDSRRRHPLAEHRGLSPRDAQELVTVYLALGYPPERVRLIVTQAPDREVA
jgi:hypothetical protein